MPATIEPFDLDAWLTDAAPPQRSVTVYGRGDLIAKLEDLAARPAAPGDQRLGGNVRSAELDAVKAQIQQRLSQVKMQKYQDDLRKAAKTDYKFSN